MPSGLDNLGINSGSMAAINSMQARGPLTPITATTYTLKSSDVGKYLRFTAAGAVTLTINNDAAGSALVNGGEVTVEAGGAGGVTFAGSSTRNGATAALAQYAVRRIRKVSANTYTLY